MQDMKSAGAELAVAGELAAKPASDAVFEFDIHW